MGGGVEWLGTLDHTMHGLVFHVPHIDPGYSPTLWPGSQAPSRGIMRLGLTYLFSLTSTPCLPIWIGRASRSRPDGEEKDEGEGERFPPASRSILFKAMNFIRGS